MKSKKILTLVIIACLLLLYYIFNEDSTANGAEPTGDTATMQMEALLDQKNTLNHSNKQVVYVTGAVEEPGLYRLEGEMVLGDLIKAAGGLLPYAQVEGINMAEVIQENSHIHIPFSFTGDLAELTRKKKISINNSNEKELATIKGIGLATAKRIIEYRNEKGPFTNLEDIQKVKGIGPGLFNKMKPFISL